STPFICPASGCSSHISNWSTTRSTSIPRSTASRRRTTPSGTVRLSDVVGRIAAVNRRVLIIAFAGFVLAAVLAVLTLTGPAPRPREAAPVERPAPPPPAAAESTPAPPPAPEPARPAARRAPAKAAPNPAPASAPAAEPATPAADVGTLHIDTDVPGAQGFIDPVVVRATRVTAANVAPGSHRLNVSAPGYDGVAETVDVAAGPRDIVVKLKVVRLDAAIAVVHKHRMGSCRGRLIATAR